MGGRTRVNALLPILLGNATVEADLGNFEIATKHLSEIEANVSNLRSLRYLGELHLARGWLAEQQQEWVAAKQWYEQAMHIWAQIDELVLLPWTKLNLAHALLHLNDHLPDCHSLISEGLATFQAIEHIGGQILGLTMRGMMYRVEENWDKG